MGHSSFVISFVISLARIYLLGTGLGKDKGKLAACRCRADGGRGRVDEVCAAIVWGG